MIKTRVGVLRGGPSGEYDVSLKSGASVLKNMPDKYSAHDIYITRDGVWHMGGIPRNPHYVLQNVDVVLNALHGEYGEDGKVQALLDSFGIPYTGSGAMASAVGMNKLLAKKAFINHGLKTPFHVSVENKKSLHDELYKIMTDFPRPSYIVKPASSGSSLGVSLVKNLSSLEKAVAEALKYSKTVIVEEFVGGREATCGVVDSSNRSGVYPLPPVEIRYPDKSDIFDFNAKYSGEAQEICPGEFTDEEREEIQDIAIKAHKALGLRHYSRSDVIVTDGGVYILEVNTLPGLTQESLFPKSLEASGCSLSEFLDHLITLALQR